MFFTYFQARNPLLTSPFRISIAEIGNAPQLSLPPKNTHVLRTNHQLVLALVLLPTHLEPTKAISQLYKVARVDGVLTVHAAVFQSSDLVCRRLRDAIIHAPHRNI